MDKAQERATKRIAKLAQKEKVPPQREEFEKDVKATSVPMSSIVDQGPQLQTSTSKSTKRKPKHLNLTEVALMHGPSIIEIINDSDISIDEFICNLFLMDILADLY